MIYEQSDKLVQRNMGCGNSVVGELAVFDFVDHVLDLLLGGVVAHSSHQVWQLVDGHLFEADIRPDTAQEGVPFLALEHPVNDFLIQQGKIPDPRSD